MGKEIPDWLKKSAGKIEENRQKNNVLARNLQSRHTSETETFEKTMSSFRNSWGQLNVDGILADVMFLLGGDKLSRLSDYDSHDAYHLQSNQPREPRFSKSVYKDYEYESDIGSGTETSTETLFSINLNSSGYLVRYFINNAPRSVVNKNLSFPKTEDELKERIDKFLSSII